MMHELLKTVVVKSHAATKTGSNGPVVLTSTGDKFQYSVFAPIRILKWGYVVDAVAIVTGGSGLVLKLDKRPTAGSDTNRATLDTLTIADAVNTGSPLALGTGGYRDGYTVSVANVSTPASQVSGAGPLGAGAQPIEAGQQQFTAKSGEELIIKVDTAVTTSGQVSLFIEYELLPVSKPSGYGTTDAGTVSLTDNLTRLAS